MLILEEEEKEYAMRFLLVGSNRNVNAQIITDDSCSIYRLTHWVFLPLNILSNLNLSNWKLF